MARTGFPVTTSFGLACSGSFANSGNDEATAPTKRERKRLALPITAFWSCTQVAMPSCDAAMIGGNEG